MLNKKTFNHLKINDLEVTCTVVHYNTFIEVEDLVLKSNVKVKKTIVMYHLRKILL